MTTKETAREKLHRAALELFTERGYEATTAADIAARVGVTERTFFRHFPDKREVLFGGEELLNHAVTSGIEALAPGASLLDGLCDVLVDRVVPVFVDREESARARAVIVAGSAALREREIAKAESLREAIADALIHRGVTERIAHLAAATTTAVLHQAVGEWFARPGARLADLVTEAFDAAATLHCVTLASPG